MTASPDNWIVREGRDPERELTSLQKRFTAITRRFEQAVRLNRFFQGLRADAFAACALFIIAFAVLVFGPPVDSVQHLVVASAQHWLSPRKSMPEAAPSESYWLQEEQTEEPVTQSGATEIHYRNCDAARAAGAAPIYIGEPGYEPRMDGDGDGIACEPWRRSRRR